MSPLRLAVVGAGHMGSHHARILSEMKGIELVAVVDPDVERARRAASMYGSKACQSLEEVVGHIDAATIAAPSMLHAEIASFLLDEGIHCLVEKPLAPTREECETLIGKAREHGRVLLVGHVERFNPVTRQLAAIVKDRLIYAADFRRLSVSVRSTEVNVVTDLMIHDLDILLWLMGQEVTSVAAQGVSTNGTSGQDLVSAMLGFAQGGIATLTASRITDTKMREIQLTTDFGFITANFSTQELLVHRRGRVSALGSAPDPSNYVLDLATERVLIRAEEPLRVELRHFVEAVRGEATPLVSGEDALRALNLVWEIQSQISASPTLTSRV